MNRRRARSTPRHDHLYAVILAGGEGNRFWPLSRRTTPKQFLRIAGGDTLLQQTVRRIAPPLPAERIIVVTNASYREDVRWQLRDCLKRSERAHLLLEPAGRNTAPAIGLAAAYVATLDPDAIMLVMPSDHAVEPVGEFWKTMHRALPFADEGELVTIGIVPTGPSTAYGYIERNGAITPKRGGRQPASRRSYRIRRFIEKPPAATARRFIRRRSFYWNGGIFLWRAGTILEALRRHAPKIGRLLDEAAPLLGTVRQESAMARAYDRMPSLSIDYAVMERARRAVVVEASFQWSDLGSLTALDELLPLDRMRNAVVGEVVAVDTAGSILYGGRRLLAAIGLRDMVVVDTPDALLVCSKSRAQDVKQIVGELKRKNSRHYHLPHVETRPWGSFAVLEEGPHFKVKRLVVNPRARLSLQMHRRRSEHWVVVSGRARATIGRRQYELRENESTFIPPRTRHRLENPFRQPLELIEVQSGPYLGEDDIVRFSDDYQRLIS